MKTKIFLSLITLFLPIANVFAQGVAPFWEPLPGPGAAIPRNFHLLSDSQVSVTVGRKSFIFVPNTNSWIPLGSPESRPLPAIGATPHGGGTWIVSGDTVYSNYRDTVYFSSNFGKSWRSLGSFIKSGKGYLQDIFELPSGIVVIMNDSNMIFLSSNNFATVDTESAPELPRYLWNEGDTLWTTTVYGDYYVSADYAKTWKLFYGFHSSSPNYYSGIWMGNNLWLIVGYQRDTTFPYGISNVYLGYSSDKGSSWTRMTNPKDDDLIGIVGEDNGRRIFVVVNQDSCFRSDDLGQTWQLIPYVPTYIMSDGTLYTTNLVPVPLFSTDHGNTWDTLGTKGLLGVPTTMAYTTSDAWVSTQDSVFVSSDLGTTWKNLNLDLFSSSTGYLSNRPDSSNVLMMNTTQRIYPYDGQRSLCGTSSNPPAGLGCITSGFQIWVLSNYSAYNNRVITESADSGCSWPAADTISSTPVRGIVETSNDTILAASTSVIIKVYETAFGQIITFDTVSPEPASVALPTGAIMRDSTGANYVALSDGKLFVTQDGANTWKTFLSPETDGSSPITSLAASPNGLLFAVDSNFLTGYTRTWEYDPQAKSWSNVTTGLKRPEFPDTATVTNVWCVNGYAYVGTWNMGLFRSMKPVGPVSNVAVADHYTPFKLYPDPASTFVTLTSPSFIRSVPYRIIDITGKEWARGTIPPNTASFTLDVHGFSDGIYEFVVNIPVWIPAKFVVKH